MTFEEVYEEFKIYVAKRHKKQSFDCFAYNFKANILSYFKNMDINKICANDILNWQGYILEKNFCNNHNKNLYSMLKSFFNFCQIKYKLNIDFMVEIEPFEVKIEEHRTDFYSLKEFKRFIKFVDNNVYKQFFNLMFYAGTRPGEAMALKFSDLNPFNIRINKTIDSHGKREIGTPKTISSNRFIAIDKKLYNDLIMLKKYYIKKYGDDNYDYFIFGGKKPLAPTTINRHKINACNKAKIRPITLHQFRHSHATLLMNKGILIHDISKRLGHSKVSTTLDVYTHSKQEKRVINTLNHIRFNFFDCFAYKFKN